MDAPVLHAKIQRQSQQCIAALRFAIACDEQKKRDDNQIACVAVFWQKMPQKADSALLVTRR